MTNFYINIDKNTCAFLFLEKLDLNSNKISSLDGNNFDKLKNLKFLNLLWNQIKVLSTFDLNKFNQLKEMKLGNDVMIIDEDYSFQNLFKFAIIRFRIL